jgi:hypothetical protein
MLMAAIWSDITIHQLFNCSSNNQVWDSRTMGAWGCLLTNGNSFELRRFLPVLLLFYGTLHKWCFTGRMGCFIIMYLTIRILN